MTCKGQPNQNVGGRPGARNHGLVKACSALSQGQHRALSARGRSLCTRREGMESYGVDRDSLRRAVLLARHKQSNTLRWVAQQSQRVCCPAGYHLARPKRDCSPRSPFTAAHSTARPSLLAPHTHPSQSLSLAARHHTRFYFVARPSTSPLLTSSEQHRSFLLQPVEIKG